MRVAVITEGGGGRGHGHLTRCAAICDALSSRGIRPAFIASGDQSLVRAAGRRRLELLDWVADPEALLRRIDGWDAVVVDSYMAPRGLYARIRARVRAAVYLDDTRRLDYPPGIIVNGAVNAPGLAYPRRPGRVTLLGCAYSPLRKAFWTAPCRRTRVRVADVLVTVGGEDIHGLVPRTLAALRGFPGCRPRVARGLSASAMKALMLRCDIAVTAGGQTLYELARLGVPAIAMLTADNQRSNVEGWAREGFALDAGRWDDRGLEEAVARALRSLADPKVRGRMSAGGRRLVDGKGALRIVSSLCEQLR